MDAPNRIKVLVVEDVAMLRDAYCSFLDDLNYSFRPNAGFVYDLKKEIREYQPHLLLMDTGLPGTVGYEECAKLRETELGKKLKIIGMSVDEDCKQYWLAAGANAFWRKNIDNWREELEQVIKRVLEE